MKKTVRKTIRINGKEEKKRFDNATDAKAWYNSKWREKQFIQDGLEVPIDDKMILRDYFNLKWMPKRKEAGYPASTTAADEQRFRDYVDGMLGMLRVSRINQIQVRQCIANVCESHKRSIETRNRVRSLLSKVFNDAMNERPPLRKDNPALNISFTDARKGKKPPKYLGREKDIKAFLKAAKDSGMVPYVYAVLALSTGLRKSELIALKWNDFDAGECELRIDEHFEQESMSLKPGTKAGSEEIRIVPLSDEVIEILEKHRGKADFQGEDDFILTKGNGELIPPREFHNLHDMIRKKAGVDVTPHGLRHTMGRRYVLNEGTIKELQSLLGHASSSVTELYSELASKEVKKSRNKVTLGLGDLDEE